MHICQWLNVNPTYAQYILVLLIKFSSLIIGLSVLGVSSNVTVRILMREGTWNPWVCGMFFP